MQLVRLWTDKSVENYWSGRFQMFQDHCKSNLGLLECKDIYIRFSVSTQRQEWCHDIVRWTVMLIQKWWRAKCLDYSCFTSHYFTSHFFVVIGVFSWQLNTLKISCYGSNHGDNPLIPLQDINSFCCHLPQLIEYRITWLKYLI